MSKTPKRKAVTDKEAHMPDRKKNPKYIKRYQSRAYMVSTANIIYRSVLRALLPEDFPTIDAMATRGRMSLHKAAKDFVKGTWKE